MKRTAEIKAELQKQLAENKEKWLKAFIVLLITFVVVLVVNHFPAVAAYLLIAVITILLMISWLMAGIAVFKPLFAVSAELTLMIFLAQTYCEVPNTPRSSDGALLSLFTFGLLYVTALFFKSADKVLKEMLTKLKELNRGDRSTLMEFLLGIFIVLFLVQLYQVVSPIILNLCIYKV